MKIVPHTSVVLILLKKNPQCTEKIKGRRKWRYYQGVIVHRKRTDEKVSIS